MKKRRCTEEKWLIDPGKQIEERVNLLRTEIKAREEAIAKAPEGTLRVVPHGKGYQCFHRDTPQCKSGVYIPQNKIKLAYDLAQKDYNLKFIRLAKRELHVLENCQTQMKEIDYEEIYNGMHAGRKQFVKPILTPKDELIRKWEAMEYVHKGFRPDDNEYYTNKDERVRSKSEINIANMLKDYGIPYHYEYPIEIDGETYNPDFYVLNVRKRKVYVWDHFGMMDDYSYARENVDKINKYILAGYIPGENYIQSFETSKNPINQRVIKKIIEDYLL